MKVKSLFREYEYLCRIKFTLKFTQFCSLWESRIFEINVILILFYFLKVHENKALSRTSIPRYCKTLKYIIYVSCDQCLWFSNLQWILKKKYSKSLFKIKLNFTQMTLRVNLVLIFAHMRHFFRKWATVSTRENLNSWCS